MGYHGAMATLKERLREREKELACVYSICLLAAGGPEPRDAAEGIARVRRVPDRGLHPDTGLLV